MEWVRKLDAFCDIALDYLSLGQAYLSQAPWQKNPDLHPGHNLPGPSGGGPAPGRRDDMLSLRFLARGGLYRVQKGLGAGPPGSAGSHGPGHRSGMALHQADAHLEYARLHLAQGQPEKARPHLATAKKMITDLGYGRRRQDVLDLEAQLRRTPINPPFFPCPRHFPHAGPPSPPCDNLKPIRHPAEIPVLERKDGKTLFRLFSPLPPADPAAAPGLGLNLVPAGPVAALLLTTSLTTGYCPWPLGFVPLH